MKLLIILSFLFFGFLSQANSYPYSNINLNNNLSHTAQLVSEVQKSSNSSFGNSLQSENQNQSTLNYPILELGLEYPINFGVQLKYMIHDVSYVRFGFGFMSSFFLKSFESFSSSLGYLNQHEVRLLSDAFQNSMYLDLRLGWIPYFKKMGGGPYLELGLSNALLGKGMVKGRHLSRVIPSSYDETETYSAKTTSFNGTFHIGYSIPFEAIKLNLEVGVLKILHASFMDLDADQLPLNSKAMSQNQEKLFKKFLERRGWVFPTFSGWISFSF